MRVRANVAVFGLEVNDLADVEDAGEIHDLIASGMLSVVPTSTAPTQTNEVLSASPLPATPPWWNGLLDLGALDDARTEADAAAAAASTPPA